MLERVAVVGSGAIGGLLAARLAGAGCEVHLLGRTERWRRALLPRGLKVFGSSEAEAPSFVSGSRLHPAVRPRGPACSAVYVCVKSRDTASALAGARPLTGPETAVVSLQNGLSHVAPTRRAFGDDRAVFGVCYVAARRLDPFRIRHEGGDEIVLGRGKAAPWALRSARRWLERAGLKVSVAASEERLLWTKAVFNAAANPLGALAAATNGELGRDPALRELLTRAVLEGAAAARAAGKPPLYPRMDLRAVEGCLAAPGQENSMLQDLRAGRPTEADAIVAPVLAAARRARAPAPTLEALHRFLGRLERELAA